jgi:hypothetical protein
MNMRFAVIAGGLFVAAVVILFSRVRPFPDPEVPPVVISGDGGPPTPDTAALFRALEEGDTATIATQQALTRAYFDAGGDPIQQVTVPDVTPDVVAIATSIHSLYVADRLEAMRVLAFNNAYQGGASAAGLIATGLGDSDNDVRAMAADAAMAAALAFNQARADGGSLVWDWEADTRARSAILQAVDDESEEVTSDAALALVTIYRPADDIRDALISRYAEVDTADAREAIVAGLGAHEYSSQAVADVIADARADQDPIVRGAASIATAKCSVPNAVSVLQTMLASETDPDVKLSIEAAMNLLQD